MNIIEEFGNLSGLKLNKNKTEGIWLGRLKHTKDKYVGYILLVLLCRNL
jgi:hypothetical protein